ncbi:MAG: hypothetical protein ACREUL_17790 [Steroidobacteraceae bacterium]
MTSRDITVAGARQRLEALGYACVPSDHPDRQIGSNYSAPRRGAWGEVARETAAVACWPLANLGLDHLEDCAQRQIALLTVTAYLLSDARQAKAVMSVLEKYRLTSGLHVVRPFGDKVYPLRWEHKEPLASVRTRKCFEDDDTCVEFRQTIPPTRFDVARTAGGFSRKVALDQRASHILSLDAGEWKSGDLLSIPRRDLPELLEVDVREIVSDRERARFGARPAAVARDAA